MNTKSAAFVKAFLDGSVDPKEKLALLQDACTRHSNTTRDAMSGRGIDRYGDAAACALALGCLVTRAFVHSHLFGLYIVSKGKSIESPFLNKALSDPWRLSTSQQVCWGCMHVRSCLHSLTFTLPTPPSAPAADEAVGSEGPRHCEAVRRWRRLRSGV